MPFLVQRCVQQLLFQSWPECPTLLCPISVLLEPRTHTRKVPNVGVCVVEELDDQDDEEEDGYGPP